MRTLPLLFCCALLLNACGQTSKKTTEQILMEQEKEPPPGSDRDAHGCITSAGFRWSVLNEECVRVFEVGVRLNPQAEGLDPATAAYIIFSNDQSKAELFIPGEEESKVLEKTGEEGAHSWVLGEWKLFPWKGYALQRGETLLYAGE
jgi:hypothetical protein